MLMIMKLLLCFQFKKVNVTYRYTVVLSFHKDTYAPLIVVSSLR